MNTKHFVGSKCGGSILYISVVAVKCGYLSAVPMVPHDLSAVPLARLPLSLVLTAQSPHILAENEVLLKCYGLFTYIED
jgi:hypothetical protein